MMLEIVAVGAMAQTGKPEAMGAAQDQPEPRTEPPRRMRALAGLAEKAGPVDPVAVAPAGRASGWPMSERSPQARQQ